MNLKQKLLDIQNKNLSFKKDATNPFFKSKYITLEAIWEVLEPELKAHKLLVIHGTRDGEVFTEVWDTDNDEHVSSKMPLPQTLKPQELGSAVTYYKRYNLAQIFNIMADEDDDGNRANNAEITSKDVNNDDLNLD